MEKEKSSPFVSVIMPAYNAEKYIAEAIESVMAQTYENWELIVIDDGSIDSTKEIAKQFSENDDRIYFYTNEKNMGVAMTRNRGLELASGDYVALLDSDDIWLPEKLEKQLIVVEKTGADIVYTSYGIIDIDGNKIRDDYIVPEKTDFDSMLKENHIGCSTVLIKKELSEHYKFNKEYSHEDYVLWMQLLKEGYLAIGISETLVKYRFYVGSRAANKINAARNRWIIYRKYLKLSFIKSIFSLTNYALAGIIKYGCFSENKMRKK